MTSVEELLLAPQFDGLAASVRALVRQMSTGFSAEARLEFVMELARDAAADVRARTADPAMAKAQKVMLATIANTFEVPVGTVLGN